MLVSKFDLERKIMEYTGLRNLDSIAAIHIEIAGLRHLIKEAEAKISAHEQVLIIAAETEQVVDEENKE